MPEDRRIIPGLTVEENIDLARIAGNSGWSYERLYSLFPRLKERRTQEGTTLSGGEQQMLAIARALAREIRLLLLDEPYEGLAPVIRHDIERALLEVKADGITTILVEQNAVAALKLSDSALILDSGGDRVLGHGQGGARRRGAAARVPGHIGSASLPLAAGRARRRGEGGACTLPRY